MGSAENNCSSENAMTVDDRMKDEDHTSHLHVFQPGLSGKDRLLSLLLSPYIKSNSEFKGKIAIYVNEEAMQHELLDSEFTRLIQEDYITSAVVNAFFGC